MVIEKEPFLTVLFCGSLTHGSRNQFVELDHRAEATVLMGSLRVFSGA